MSCIFSQSVGSAVACFNRHIAGAVRYKFVSPSRCTTCPYFRGFNATTVELPVLTECTQRGKQVKDAPCGCATVHRCKKHGYCTTANGAVVRERFTAAEDTRLVYDCQGCADQWHPLLDKTQVIVPFHNPLGWFSRTENLAKARAAMSVLRDICQLAVADLEHGTPGQRYWMKEAITNQSVRESDAEYVAWIDADLVWDDPLWLQRGLLLLDQFDAVQLWQTLREDGQPDRTSSGYHWCTDGKRDGSPGGAWLMRRDKFLEIGGLPEYMLTGGGDSVALDAWTQQDRPWNWDDFSDELRTLWLAYRERCQGLRIGYLPVTVTHLSHGSLRDRQYESRTALLRRFNPSRDFRLAANGLPELVNLDLLDAAREYLHSRREDG